jgi:hypothetical protein
MLSGHKWPKRCSRPLHEYRLRGNTYPIFFREEKLTPNIGRLAAMGMIKCSKSFAIQVVESGFIIREHNVHPEKEYMAATIEEVKAKVEELLNDKAE